MSRRSPLLVAALALLAGSSQAQVLPWEITVAEVEAGRIRSLAQRLSKQNLLFQLRIGETRKSEMLETAEEIDRIIESLQEGRPRNSIPAPWTPQIEEQLAQVDRTWGPLRAVATADAHQHLRVNRQFAPRGSSRRDPLLVRYFDLLSLDLVAESEKLLAIYLSECNKTGLEICETATQTGYTEMLVERATKEAVYVSAGIDVPENRKRLAASVAAYEEQVRANDQNPFFAAAMDPTRNRSAQALGQLFVSLRGDWETMSRELTMLSAGDEENFDVRALITIQNRLVGKIERLTAALLRYATLTYGA